MLFRSLVLGRSQAGGGEDLPPCCSKALRRHGAGINDQFHLLKWLACAAVALGGSIQEKNGRITG